MVRMFILNFFSFLYIRYCRAATSAQTSGFPSSSQLGYRTRADAQAAWVHALANHTVGPPRNSPPMVTRVLSAPLHSSLASQALPTPIAWSSGPASAPSVACAQIPIGCPSPQLQVPPSLSAQKAFRPTPPPSGRFPQLASFPSMPRQHPIVLTHRSPVSPEIGVSDEAAYWVVTIGANPGVYLGK